jgi:hypothetical protein
MVEFPFFYLYNSYIILGGKYMKKLIWVIIAVTMIASILAAAPVVLAKSDTGTPAITNSTQSGILDTPLVKRLLNIQDQNKVASALRLLVRNGTLTTAQARRIMNYWQNNHTQVAAPAPVKQRAQ